MPTAERKSRFRGLRERLGSLNPDFVRLMRECDDDVGIVAGAVTVVDIGTPAGLTTAHGIELLCDRVLPQLR